MMVVRYSYQSPYAVIEGMRLGDNRMQWICPYCGTSLVVKHVEAFRHIKTYHICQTCKYEWDVTLWKVKNGGDLCKSHPKIKSQKYYIKKGRQIMLNKFFEG